VINLLLIRSASGGDCGELALRAARMSVRPPLRERISSTARWLILGPIARSRTGWGSSDHAASAMTNPSRASVWLGRGRRCCGRAVTPIGGRRRGRRRLAAHRLWLVGPSWVPTVGTHVTTRATWRATVSPSAVAKTPSGQLHPDQRVPGSVSHTGPGHPQLLGHESTTKVMGLCSMKRYQGNPLISAAAVGALLSKGDNHLDH
jgi:hypothetical protein